MAPEIISANGKRRFACYPAAILAYIINPQEEILLLRHPQRTGWEVINGAVEADEPMVNAAVRETHEEAGPQVRVRPLGAFHVQSFHYDAQVRYMLSLSCVLAYEGGAVEPGDDMHGSAFRWWSLEALRAENAPILVPPDGYWLLARAVEAYRMWQAQEVVLQPALPERAVTKYDAGG